MLVVALNDLLDSQYDVWGIKINIHDANRHSLSIRTLECRATDTSVGFEFNGNSRLAQVKLHHSADEKNALESDFRKKRVMMESGIPPRKGIPRKMRRVCLQISSDSRSDYGNNNYAWRAKTKLGGTMTSTNNHQL